MNNYFYRALEEKYRGSRELIKSRLLAYLPFIEPLLAFYQPAKAIDLGCGRGEWLELIKELGFDGYGVDLNDGMLASCRELNLSVATEDAILTLSRLPDESHVIVSAFHLVEHIGFEELQLLVQEALRILKPGGLLILETPNPENISVGTANFYIDPSHGNPIPTQLLSFLPEYYGFAKVKIIRLQEDRELLQQTSISLRDVLSGASPDYAVIAQKSAAASLLSATDDAFAQDCGLSLDVLVGKFDRQMSQVKECAAQAEAHAAQAEAHAAQAEAHAAQAEARAAQAEASAKLASEQADQEAAIGKQAQMTVHAVYASHSWRATAPLRWLAVQIRLLQEHGLITRVKALVKKMAVRTVRRAMVYLDTRPELRSRCLVLARKMGLSNRLRSLFFGSQHQNSIFVSAHPSDLASLRMMTEVNIMIKNPDSLVSIVYLEQ